MCKNTIKLTIETRLPGEKNDVRISGLTLLSRHKILEQVFWSPYLMDCTVTITAIDDERSRIAVTNPRIVAHRNLTDEGVLKILSGAIVVDAAIYRTGTIKAPKALKLDVVEVTNGNKTVRIEPDMCRSFWRSAKTVFMKAIETDRFDFLDCVRAAKDAYLTDGEPTCPDEEEVILKVCKYMRYQYWQNLYRKQESSIFINRKMDDETREIVRQRINGLDSAAEDGIYAVPSPSDMFTSVDMAAALKYLRKIGRALTEDEMAAFERQDEE